MCTCMYVLYIVQRQTFTNHLNQTQHTYTVHVVHIVTATHAVHSIITMTTLPSPLPFTYSFIWATTSSSSSAALLMVMGRERPLVRRFGVLGTVSLTPNEELVSSLFPLLDDTVDWPLKFALTCHFLVTLPGLLLNRGGVAFWYFSMASATETTSPEDGVGLDLKRSSRQNLNGFTLR